MLEDILSVLGFSTEESRIYLALLETGPSAAGVLARKTGIPRPSLYGMMERMIEKGALSQSEGGGVKIFTAARPEAFNGLFRNRIEELETRQGQFEKLIPELNRKSMSGILNPQFEFFEGREGVKNVLRDMLLYSGIETQSFWPIRAMVEALSPEFFHYHNKIRIKNRVSVRALWPRNQIVEIRDHPYLGAGKDYLREIRVAPENAKFSMGYWIYKDKIAFLSSLRECFGFIIESREMVEMMKVQFEIVWGLSRPLPVKR